MNVALIGLGAMGLGMARNILAAGIPLRGFDLSATALDTFSALGGVALDSAASAVADCDVAVLMVVDAAQTRAVLFDAGVADKMKSGGVVVITSTISPSSPWPTATIRSEGCNSPCLSAGRRSSGWSRTASTASRFSSATAANAVSRCAS